MNLPCETFTSQQPDAPDADLYPCETCIAEGRGYHTKLSHDLITEARATWAAEKAALVTKFEQVEARLAQMTARVEALAAKWERVAAELSDPTCERWLEPDFREVIVGVRTLLTPSAQETEKP